MTQQQTIDKAKEHAYETYRFNLHATGNEALAMERARREFFMQLDGTSIDRYVRKDAYIEFVESLGY